MTELDNVKERLIRAILNHLRPCGREDAIAAIDEAYQLGRSERDAELAAELTGGSSILRDPAAVVDISQVVDNPAGDAWMEEG